MVHSLYMPIYWGDYLSDTMGFSVFEHGLYLMLIAHYWQNGGPIPADPAHLARVTGASHTNVVRHGRRVLMKFTHENGSLRHQRIDSELLKSSNRQAAAIANGKAGGLAKRKLPYHTKEKRKNGDARGSAVDKAEPALSPERVAELQDKTDKHLKRGKYMETYQ